jgi:hypothetical protein
MKRVMISYSTKRQDTADRLHAMLKKRGAKPRLDRLDIDPGERWRESIGWWLSACDAAVVLLCPDAIASPWVRYELSVLSNRALVGRDLRVILVCLGGVQHAQLAKDPAFIPCGLDGLQNRDIPALEVTDAEMEEIVDALAALPNVDAAAPLEDHIGEAESYLHDLPHYQLGKLRKRLPNERDPDNDWDFVSGIPSGSEEEHRMRWAAASDFCAAPVERTRSVFEWLATPPKALSQEVLNELARLGCRVAVASRAAAVLYQRHAESERG